MSNPILRTVPWTIARGPGLVFVCQRCGATHDHSDEAEQGLPMRAICHLMRAFQEIHRSCEVPHA